MAGLFDQYEAASAGSRPPAQRTQTQPPVQYPCDKHYLIIDQSRSAENWFSLPAQPLLGLSNTKICP